MLLTKTIRIFKGFLYLFIFSNNKSFVFCQYTTDYFNLDNAIGADGNVYYHSKVREYENVNQDADIGAMVGFINE